jgi:hypothetical protein
LIAINTKGDPTMLTPQTAEWLAGRVTVNRDRDAQQLADLRVALERCRARVASPVERLQALLGRTQDPAVANCDCSD